MTSTFVMAGVATAVFLFIVILLDERYGLLSSDRFPSENARYAAYAWLGLITFFITTSVIGSASSGGALDLEKVRFVSIFSMHAVLITFLLGWWLLSGRKPIRQFLNLHGDELPQSLAIGIAAGVGGWLVTITVALIFGMIAQETGMMPENLEPAPMILFLSNLAVWQKLLIVGSAMTVEEFFFRGWLQKRFGLAVSTAIFALAHAGYGQPMLLIGVTVISLVIGTTFYYTRRLLPCIIAHGVFDAIQIFMIVPFALKATGAG